MRLKFAGDITQVWVQDLSVVLNIATGSII